MSLTFLRQPIVLLLLVVGVVVLILGLGTVYAPQLSSRAARNAGQTAVDGTLEVWIGERWTETANDIGVEYEETVYVLRTDSGQRLRLSNFSPTVDLQPNTRLRLQGRQMQGPNGPELQNAKIIGGTSGQVRGATTGSQRVAVVVLQFSDAPHATTPATPGFARQVFFDGPQAVAKYYREASYSQLELAGDVLGPYTIPYGSDRDWGRCSQNIITATEEAAKQTGQDLSIYDYVQYILPDGSNCGQINAWASSGGVSVIDKRWYLPIVAAHELGHNLGLGHAYALRCFENNQAVTISNDCEQIEDNRIGRGDVFDPMGSHRYFHFHNIHKERLGWLQPHNIQEVTDSGHYTLLPIEQASSGVQAIRIPLHLVEDSFSSTLSRYELLLEYRRPYGFDAFQATDSVVNGVTLRVTSRFSDTLLLDATPATTSVYDAALPAGQTLRIPQINICITTVLAAPDRAEVDIQFSCPSPTSSPSPSPTSSTVRGVSLLYGQSAFGIDLALDKTALRPGLTASFANISGYSRGINGLIIDIDNLPNDGIRLDNADFEFRVGNSNDVSVWSPDPYPILLPVRPGAGQQGSDRLHIHFPDGAIKNTWLAVTIKANPDTGLAEPYTFYFGSAVGDTGATFTENLIGADAADLQSISQHITPLDQAGTEPITNSNDLNKDGTVDAFDFQVVAGNLKPRILELITPQ
ncbi:MAG TPA: hypothetical protein VJC05_00045 [Candidatus Andersenbacteria bacterium]|nr:hypothetical protein [Candidatus Andersenbacteria bacterium]